MTRRQKPQATALDAFLSAKIEIDALLARLKALSDDHFGADPEVIDWGHVGDLGRMRTQLQDIADRAFHEGEYAA